jgi:cytochrome o ubiquinol oxidase subunit 1
VSESTFAQALFGRLSWDSLAFLHEPILLWTFIPVVLLGAGIVGAVSYFRLLGWLWREWFTSRRSASCTSSSAS